MFLNWVVFVCIGDGKLSVNDPFLRLDLLMEGAKTGQFSPNHDHFQALVVIQMDMHVRNNIMMKTVLYLHENDRKIAYVMIIYEDDRARYILLSIHPSRF